MKKPIKPKRQYVKRAQIAAELALTKGKPKRKYVKKNKTFWKNTRRARVVVLPVGRQSNKLHPEARFTTHDDIDAKPPWEYPEDDSVLVRAKAIVDGRDKSAHYGPPEHSMRCIAHIWSGVLGHEITAEQVALMMLGLKMARLSVDPKHLDGLLDAAGYIRILERLQGKPDV